MRVICILAAIAALGVGCKSASKSASSSDPPPSGGDGNKNGEPVGAGSAPGNSAGSGDGMGGGNGRGSGEGSDAFGDPHEPDRPKRHDERPITDDVGQVVAVGSLDQSLIRREIKKRLPDVNKCYEQAVAGKPTLAGAIVAQFTIEPDGKVSEAKSTGLDDELGACVARVIAQITFPKPKNGGNVSVKYPFQFRLAAPAGSGSGSG